VGSSPLFRDGLPGTILAIPREFSGVRLKAP